jgi:endonuclease YncB( thermonuclease family)
MADVFLADGINFDQELVKQGWCWKYRKYAPGDTVLEGLETEAGEARKGLRADPQPMAPWKWQKVRTR